MECDIFWNIQQTKWFATFIWVPHLLTLTTTPNFLNLEISTQLTWMPEREKHSPMPPVPLRTPVARRLAQAKYCENCSSHTEEEAEKSRIQIARYRASIKADPERVQEQKDRKKCANKAYREKNRHLIAFKKQEKRKEANVQKGTKQGYQVEEKKDYALEYALWTHRRQDELQQRVSDTLWRDKDGATLASPSTVSTLSATGATFSVHRFAHVNPCRAPPHPLDQEGFSRSPFPPPLEAFRCGPGTLPPALDPPLNAIQTYLVRGSGNFNIAAARGQATLCATDNPRVATHVSAGHTQEEARALLCLGNLGGQVLKEEYAYDSMS
ncbi:hypothetical protein K438DRAFT_1747149 [Mycena galopus ATCC 62051]|nr:hypothetical protein K438DRAFT_1747149 [Mycena galopus ATCC 62051]